MERAQHGVSAARAAQDARARPPPIRSSPIGRHAHVLPRRVLHPPRPPCPASRPTRRHAILLHICTIYAARAAPALTLASTTPSASTSQPGLIVRPVLILDGPRALECPARPQGSPPWAQRAGARVLPDAQRARRHLDRRARRVRRLGAGRLSVRQGQEPGRGVEGSSAVAG